MDFRKIGYQQFFGNISYQNSIFIQSRILPIETCLSPVLVRSGFCNCVIVPTSGTNLYLQKYLKLDMYITTACYCKLLGSGKSGDVPYALVTPVLTRQFRTGIIAAWKSVMQPAPINVSRHQSRNSKLFGHWRSQHRAREVLHICTLRCNTRKQGINEQQTARSFLPQDVVGTMGTNMIRYVTIASEDRKNSEATP